MYKYFKNRYKTSHLSLEENTELMRRYYDGENIEQLIKEYNIDISKNDFSSTFQLKKTPEKICTYCKSEMYYLPPSRSAQYKKEYICKTCFHIEGKYSCECQNCLTHKQEEANKKRILSKKKTKESEIQESLILQENAISVEELSLKERVYLGAILRCNPLTKNTFFVLDRRFLNGFAPTVPYSNMILEALMERGVIFEISSDETSVKFAVNIRDIHVDKNLLIDLMYPEQIQTVEEELMEIIRDIQSYEAIEYFALIARKFNLPYFAESDIEDKFFTFFRRMLNSNYSTAQLFNFIYTAIRNTAAKNNCFMQNTNLLHEIYIALLSRYEKSVTNNWTIGNYNRVYQQKISELFKLVSTDLLGIRDALFYKSFNS